jgi:hypothetical protein
MSILEHVKATWFLARINLRKGRRNLLQIYTDSNKITLLHSCECKADCMKTNSLEVNMTHLSWDRICGEIFCMAIMMALLTWYTDMTSNHWMLIPSFHIRET